MKKVFVISILILVSNQLFSRSPDSTIIAKSIRLIQFGINVYEKDTKNFSNYSIQRLQNINSKLNSNRFEVINFEDTLKDLSAHPINSDTFKNFGPAIEKINKWWEKGKGVKVEKDLFDLKNAIETSLKSKSTRLRDTLILNFFTKPADGLLENLGMGQSGNSGNAGNVSEYENFKRIDSIYIQRTIDSMLIEAVTPLSHYRTNFTIALSFLAFILSISILGCFYFYKKLKKQINENETDKKSSDANTDFEEFKKNMKAEFTKIDDLNAKINGINETFETLKNEIGTSRNNLPGTNSTSSFDTSSESTKLKSTTDSSNAMGKIMYAKFPDLPNGFSDSTLFDKQNGERIYKIKIEDKEATFTISSDEAAQEYALSSMKEYLEKACEYSNMPSANRRIHTQKPGKLIKSGDNWIIQSKAKIEFK